MQERFTEEAICIPYVSRKDPMMDAYCRLNELERLASIQLGLGILSREIEEALETIRQEHYSVLGINDCSDREGFNVVYRKLHDARNNPPVPSDFPAFEEFENQLRIIVEENKGGRRLFKPFSRKQPKKLPPQPDVIKASDLAKYAQAEWYTLQKRGDLNLERYIYMLGVSMCNEYSYRSHVRDWDFIAATSDWTVVAGRHRSLALRVLGEDYVFSSGMNDWVTVVKM